ncbi:Ig-like domain-containing protein [Erwinia sorbitola]|uniref:DUF4347 domain-containing protein n=1 Tax=Erwinia sorbitola TaxID=2681984 RepID=A0A6I6EKV8_9GAMM|nr:Ig-like domain-containing protein [Erwinia sorbitola]QGU87251.1 DUF4347 domain-containing protein [Erwinia sorbitola]
MTWQNWFGSTKRASSQNVTNPKEMISNSVPRTVPAAWLLEPRMLFDGAIAATVVENAANSATASDTHATAADSKADSHADSSHAAATTNTASETTSSSDQHHNSDSSDSQSDAVTPAATPARHEVVFIDTSLKNYQTLVDGIQPGVEIVLIDGSKDGLQQIASWASTHSGYDAIHIFSHGSEGKLNLGSTVLTDSSIKSADVQAALAVIGQSLKADGDLLLYGCDVGAGSDGAAFVADLAAATGADVAASVDATGSSKIGGDWVLEKSIGDIDTAALHIDGYQDVLSVVTFSESDSDLDGSTLSITRPVEGQNITFAVPNNGAYMGLDMSSYGTGIYALDGSINGSNTSLVISSPAGYSFDLTGLKGIATTGILHFELTFSNGTTGSFNAVVSENGYTAISNFSTAINDVTRVVITSNDYSALQDITISDVKPIAPAVVSVSATTANGAYKAGDTVMVTVNFSSVVMVNTTGGTPTLLLETGTIDRLATYVSGSGTSQLIFSYTVSNGDQSADLNYVSSSSLALNGSTISDSNSVNATLTLPDTGAQYSLGWGKNIVIDTQLPTATITLSDTALKTGETATVTIIFSEAVSGFDNSDLTVANGTLSAVSSADGGVTWIATFTPDSSVTDNTNTIGLAMSGVHDVAGNNGSGNVSSPNYAIDTLRPTASIVVADNTLTAGETSLVTITFNEAVTGFTLADLSVENGVMSGLSTSDGGITWTATLTPVSNASDATNVITLANSGVADLAGNAGSGTTNSNNFSVSTRQPTSTIVIADNTLNIGKTSQVTITFSEAVTGFTNADLVVANGTLSAVSSSDGITWTATLTPTADTTDATNAITLDNSGVQNAAGNIGIGSATSNNYAVDTHRPTATITMSDTALKIGDTSTVTITFSEAVSGLTNADVTTTNGGLSLISSADGGLTWTATFTPTSNITDTSNIITLDNTGIADLAGNAGSGSTESVSYSIDTRRPNATIVVADNALTAGETSLVTITFSEAVTGFTNADLTVTNGTLSAVSSSDGGVTWIATFTPVLGFKSASNQITLNNAGVADLAGNAGSGNISSNNFSIDTQRPTASVVVADNALRIGETSLVTITFTEPVTGFTNADLTVANGTLTAVTTSDGGMTWTATFTPSSDLTNAANMIIVDNTGVENMSGNAGSGTTSSNNYAIDTQRPTATIVMADNALAAGETSLVTITFSEAVTGFSNADVTVTNGSLTALSSSDGGMTWTATFTPTEGTNNASNAIVLDNSGVTDLAGNAGSGTTESGNYSIDTLRPTATIVMADSTLAAGESSLVTITFSEAVTGFSNSSLTVPNGTLSAVSSADGGLTWTATYTPATNVRDTTNLIVLNNTSVADLAGNLGTGTTSSVNFTIDTVRPAATVVVADPSLRAGQSSQVTITFTEAVTGFTNADLTVAGGTLSAVNSIDGGITWTATFTPAASLTSTSNLISLDNTGVANASGNTGSGTTVSNNYSIDTALPAASIVVSNPLMGNGATSLVTITFSEAVSGFDLSDISVANGTLNNLSSADGGITWTATLTPTAGVTDSTNLVLVDTSGVQDAAGNAGSGSAISNNYALDATPPVGTITLSDTQLTAGETARVTITFNEAVTGFSNADLKVSNGTLSAVVSTDGGITWTALFTPTAGTVAAGNLITLDNSGVTDLAGNAGSGSSASPAFSIDSRPVEPTTTVAGNPQFLSTDGQPGAAALAGGDGPRSQIQLITLPDVPAGLLASGSTIFGATTGLSTTPSAAIVFSQPGQGGGAAAPSALAAVFSQNDVNHYEPGVIRSQSVDLNQPMGGRSTLAGLFGGINLPGTTDLEVFSGSSWKSVSDNSITGAIAPTSVFGAPVFSQQLQWLDEVQSQQVASLEVALKNIKPAV